MEYKKEQFPGGEECPLTGPASQEAQPLPPDGKEPLPAPAQARSIGPSLEERLLHELHRCAALMRRGKPPVENPGQHRLLDILQKDSVLSQRELLEKSGIRPASLSELLAKLERIGFIRRERDEYDRRVVIVTLTEEGRSAFEAQRAERQRETAALFASLAEEEKQTLANLLEKLNASLAERGGPEPPEPPHPPFPPEPPFGHGPHHRAHHGPHHGPHPLPPHEAKDLNATPAHPHDLPHGCWQKEAKDPFGRYPCRRQEEDAPRRYRIMRKGPSRFRHAWKDGPLPEDHAGLPTPEENDVVYF